MSSVAGFSSASAWNLSCWPDSGCKCKEDKLFVMSVDESTSLITIVGMFVVVFCESSHDSPVRIQERLRLGFGWGFLVSKAISLVLGVKKRISSPLSIGVGEVLAFLYTRSAVSVV